MSGKLKQMLLDESTVMEVNEAKEFLSREIGRRATSKDVIEEFVGRRLRFLRLKKEVRDYINGFVDLITRKEKVMGIMLFGSVARGLYRKDSDIDVLIAIRGNAINCIDEIEESIDGVEELRAPLVQMGFYLRIRPLILSLEDLKIFRPIYLSIVDEGVILFERRDALTNFMTDIKRNINWRREIAEGGVVLKWKTKA
ncbi:MAG: nucleotidyltransferase domain-containing protein [Candidatus Thermoplasmatota archaeon]|jgi:predicted nucleotidyltransferase|nr:nucleotidyltransferase domain-containing protein [Candidatus Thermoplasmatota archaeon]MCL5790193.1 nucleotidyltransferase domain-containing protein [Candidatus Thermoplasmatota archaeon]